MPRQQTPIGIAEATGALEHNPGRYVDRKNAPKPSGELGKAPSYFNVLQHACWTEVAGLPPPGVLTSADRIIVEMAARLLYTYRHTDTGLSPVELGHLRSCLGSMGLTPADRGRVTGSNAPKPKDEHGPLRPRLPRTVQ